MNRRGILVLVVATLATGVAWLAAPWASRTLWGQVSTTSVQDSTYYFRLTAKYLHGDEPVDFDIVVGCGVRVTLSEAVGSSYDAFRDPLFYVKATKDGAAVLQIVPNACGGQTTDNGRVPADFLPGAIWFDSKDDFTLGIAYISEDAFENPKAKLKFLGVAIHPATKAEWEAFRPINAKNLLSPKPFSHGAPFPSVDEVRAHLWNKKKLFEWRPLFDCQGVIRFRVTDPAARDLVRRYWPITRPRFWMPAGPERAELESRLKAMNDGKGALMDEHYYGEYFRYYSYNGFSTRSGGGAFDRDGFPPKYYPYRADDGFPWVTPVLAEAPIIYRDVDLDSGHNAGLLYCYSQFRVGPWTETHLPNYFSRRFATRVDGELVEFEDEGPDFPSPFFENDEYVYFEFHFSLT
jgi:hypothetical protein